ncbi:hypothetical protein ON010_g3698 [Phytophthora cinnamomi]|nr:hypothetical protein ON010_g3698 [Phytophthora cinnamomi]
MMLIIKGCLVLQNWIIDLDGTPALTPVAIENWMEIDRAWWATEEVAGQEKPARDKRDAIRDYLFARRVEQFLQV